jgi:excisionase family DNA binding protein
MLDVEVMAPLLRAKEVAELLAVSVWHLDQLRRDGLIRSVHVGARTHRYHPDDVAEFVRRRRG